MTPHDHQQVASQKSKLGDVTKNYMHSNANPQNKSSAYTNKNHYASKVKTQASEQIEYYGKGSLAQP